VKKILILAGTFFQVPVIEYALRSGHYVITCDNKPDNPGHKLANEYINVSTTDYNGVLRIAKSIGIDGILAYASDPAALTASYVSQKLKLPGNEVNAIRTLSDKGLFRSFLADNGFNTPVYKTFTKYNEVERFFKSLHNRAYVKPVDSSGSKGITCIEDIRDLKAAFDYALRLSRKGEVIIEKEIERKGPHIHGEAFVYKGELVFILLGDQYFSFVNKCAPISTTFPTIYHEDIMSEIRAKLTEILKLINFQTGGLNIEIIRDKSDKIFFLEIGARNGGNFMPELATLASGFKMAEANVNYALGEGIDLTYLTDKNNFFTQLILHSYSFGKFLGTSLDKFEKSIVFKKEYYQSGDYVQKYRDSRNVIGVHLYKFSTSSEYLTFLEYIRSNNIILLN
jgi:biotin carboxylase